jgi:hypothetical protein
VKTKTIRAVLRKKVDDWLESIEDEAVRKLVADNTIVTGGCIASMLLQDDVNDYDVYLRTREAVVAVAQYYVARFHPKNRAGHESDIEVFVQYDRVKVVVRSAGIASEAGTTVPYEYFEATDASEAAPYVADVMDQMEEVKDVLIDQKPPYRPVFMSTNAITLSGKVQVVLRFYGEPEEIHANYDFVHCTNYWKSWDAKLVLNPKALEALLAKELVYVGSLYPVCSVFRLRKFIKRGWPINAGQLVKMCMQISALDLTNISVLEDQLTGVDCAYFINVVNRLRSKDPEKVNTAYLIEIIDRMF